MPLNHHTQKINCQVQVPVVTAFSLPFGQLLYVEHFVVLHVGRYGRRFGALYCRLSGKQCTVEAHNGKHPHKMRLQFQLGAWVLLLCHGL